MYTAIDLISVTLTTDAMGFERREETRRRVMCERKSVSGREFYSAIGAGLGVDCLISLNAIEYHDEPEFELMGKRYSVVRTYEIHDRVELTAALRR